MPLDKNWIDQTLKANMSKSFVKRMYDENPMTLDLGNGQHATHKMAWSDAGGKYVVYPTVLFDGAKLVDYGNGAMPQAMKSGNYIAFDTPEEADYFSRNYKQALTNPVFK